ncbi:hypothetical protein AAC387_Pa02g1619 [Persea americana]
MDLMMKRLPFLFLVVVVSYVSVVVSATGVFRVHHKFAGKERSLSDFKAHDQRRHGRILGAVDIPLGGTGLPSEAGLYFAEIRLGTPSKSYYVQVDTGSDILWVNCIECNRCPRKSDLGIQLSLYDIHNSASGSLVTCEQPFCSMAYSGQMEGCEPNALCPYSVTYGDGSTTAGYYVKDSLQYNQASGDLQTTAANASVIFGCGAQQSGDLGSSNQAVDGILGFGQSNTSMLSQLASSGKVKKMFAHCLDSVDGGGIFAIGQVVQPNVSTTPLVPNQPHYNLNLKAIEVGTDILQLPSDVFVSGDKKGTIIDSGTTLAYLPDTVYTPLINAIMSSQPNLKLQKIQGFLCFQFTESVDGGFPKVTLQFEDSLSLIVYPHDYLFQIQDAIWCIGWQNSGTQSAETKDMILLGDLVLSNKLVVYDLEKQVIGWTDYNCSSSIKVKDDKTGATYAIGYHNISSSHHLEMGITVLVLLFVMMLSLIC